MRNRKVSFRVKRRFYDQYREGTKQFEYREDSLFWYKRLFNPIPKTAVIFSSKYEPILEFDIEGARYTQTPQDLLREGIIYTEECIAVKLKHPYRIRPKQRKLPEWV